MKLAGGCFHVKYYISGGKSSVINATHIKLACVMTQFNVKNGSLALEDGGEKKVPVPRENKQ